jgi:tetratricopeptide (TPR) repeat protein
LGNIALRTGDYENALDCFQEAWTIFKYMGNRQGQIEAHTGLAHVQSKCGDFSAARKHACSALRDALELDSDVFLLTALAGLFAYVVPRDNPTHGLELIALVDQHPQTSQAVRLLYVDALDAFRQQLDSAQFDAAWAQGSTLDLRETVTTLLRKYAVSEESRN